MIYFDNAATSRPKPSCVTDAFINYVNEVGTSPGRGAYKLAIQASRMLYQTRKTISQFFGNVESSNVIFTKNSTEAINLFFNGYLKKGSHVLISPYEHNAVLRPLQTLKNDGIIDYDILPESVIYGDVSTLKSYCKDNTKLLVSTYASNLTGQIVFSRQLASQAHKLGLAVFVDSSQGAGKMNLKMVSDHIDFLAFTGHKDLLALPGVGGLVSSLPLSIKPLIQGGTGVHGESYINPIIFPDAYESGTLNMPAIWSLNASVRYIEDNIELIKSKETLLITTLINELSDIPSVKIYNAKYPRVSTICFNITGMPSSEVVKHLDKHGICVRGGIHCAILAHETLKTVETGAVRVSLNYMNELFEIEEFVKAIKEIVKCI